jgi:hypothetical protein
MNAPSPNGRNGEGRFTRGNKGGPGNPYAKKVGRLRAALLDAVTPEDLQAMVAALVREAKAGSVPAAREVIDRLLGPPVAADIIERLEALELDLAHRKEEPDEH